MSDEVKTTTESTARAVTKELVYAAAMWAIDCVIDGVFFNAVRGRSLFTKGCTAIAALAVSKKLDDDGTIHEPIEKLVDLAFDTATVVKEAIDSRTTPEQRDWLLNPDGQD